jgi:hypothetical protein
MRTVRIILIFLSLFALSCSATNSNIRSITAGDVNTYLKQAPRANEYPNAGADILYSYSYTEFFNDGTSVTRNIERVKKYLMNEGDI